MLRTKQVKKLTSIKIEGKFTFCVEDELILVFLYFESIYGFETFIVKLGMVEW